MNLMHIVPNKKNMPSAGEPRSCRWSIYQAVVITWTVRCFKLKPGTAPCWSNDYKGPISTWELPLSPPLLSFFRRLITTSISLQKLNCHSCSFSLRAFVNLGLGPFLVRPLGTRYNHRRYTKGFLLHFSNAWSLTWILPFCLLFHNSKIILLSLADPGTGMGWQVSGVSSQATYKPSNFFHLSFGRILGGKIVFNYY